MQQKKNSINVSVFEFNLNVIRHLFEDRVPFNNIEIYFKNNITGRAEIKLFSDFKFSEY